MAERPPYYDDAIRAANVIGWDPDVVYAQWRWETGHFTSQNFKQNNNIAGQTWTPSMGESKKGTARPANEGGYYVKYSDPVAGYIEFVQNNNRYANVKNQTTELGQIEEIKRAGWAVDPNYVKGVYGVLESIRKQYNGLDTKTGNSTGSNVLSVMYKTADPSKWVTGNTAGLDPIFLGRLAKLGEDHGKKVEILSGNRTIAEQQVLYNKYLNGTGNLAAAPGNSRHNYGLAVDVQGWARDIPESTYKKYGMHKPVKSPQNEPWHIEPIETAGKTTEQLKNLVMGSTSNVTTGVNNVIKGLADRLQTPFDEVDGGANTTFTQINNLLEFTPVLESKGVTDYIVSNGTAIGFKIILVIIGLILFVFALVQMAGADSLESKLGGI